MTKGVAKALTSITVAPPQPNGVPILANCGGLGAVRYGDAEAKQLYQIMSDTATRLTRSLLRRNEWGVRLAARLRG